MNDTIYSMGYDYEYIIITIAAAAGVPHDRPERAACETLRYISSKCN